MNTIFKYQLAAVDTQVVQMPKGAKVLCAQAQYGEPCLWARVWDEAELEPRIFHVVGTGHPFPEASRPPQYIGTVQTGPFVWHIFEKTA